MSNNTSQQKPNEKLIPTGNNMNQNGVHIFNPGIYLNFKKYSNL